MRQRVIHGTTLDIATPDEISTLLAAQNQQQDESYRREKNTFTLDANGNGTAVIGHVPPQYDWLCERITVVSGANAVISFYENQVQSSDLLEVIGLGTQGVYSDAFSNNLFVSSGSQLLIVCSGGAANGQCAYNVQIKMVKHR